MFDLPDAKRVRREDLDGSAAQSWSDGANDTIDTALEARLNAQIAKSLGLDSPYDTSQEALRPQISPRLPRAQSAAQDDEPRDNDAGEFEFRLFTSRLPTKVTLEDDSAPPQEGGLAHPRPQSFYLANHIPPALRNEYRFAAVSGEDVLLQSHRPSWGMAYPWKVTRIAVTRKAKGKSGNTSTRVDADADADTDTDTDTDTDMEGQKRQRKRPGKKKRIAERKTLQALKEKKQMETKRALDKEEQLKEKKKRLNRIKKLRKRAKNKEIKNGEKRDDGESENESD
ncbi:hypothetical protein E4U57_005662 [Claviceps arundinis]|uniref:Uncharacterized protein n=1 Tax=Claviceps arundinis TaxID=1623583 RepID=A0A9P7SMJ6_9HYPO|nr:hypothetical protein E4U56_004452 [Claviceps arundinis]KAG5964040.1 hypothetical protein E4U57_005662 [Claviceps arundinis]